MKTITLLNEKGGVGKTTLAIHIAAGLAIRGHRVVLVDADPQGNATIAFGAVKSPGFYNYLQRNAPLQEVLIAIQPERYALPDDATQLTGSLLLIPGNVETRNLASSLSDAFVFLNRMRQLQEHIDYVVVDTSPTPSLLHGGIFMATDGVIFPTKCEYWSIDGLRESLRHRDGFDAVRTAKKMPGTQLIGVVPMLYRENTIAHTENLNAMKHALGDVVWQPLHQRTIWADAADVKRSIFSIAPTSRAASEMWRVVDGVENYVYAQNP